MPNDCQGTARQRVRAIFLSDLHLGSPHAQADLCLSVLRRYEPQQIYLVGDFIDGWRLKRRWNWSPECSEILMHLCDLVDRGTSVFYTPGNHDDFLRSFDVLNCILRLRLLEVSDAFIHQTADGRRLLVTHGDLFDTIEQRSRWLSVLGSIGYEILQEIDSVWAWWKGRRGANRYTFSRAIKQYVKFIVTVIGSFEQTLLAHAESEGCDGIICGHIHTPALRRVGKLAYCNTGDWVGSCTYLLERFDGRLDLMEFQSARPDKLLSTISAIGLDEESDDREVFDFDATHEAETQSV